MKPEAAGIPENPDGDGPPLPPRRRSGGGGDDDGSWCDFLDLCDGCSGCDLLLVRVSTLLFLAAAVLPGAGTGPLVRAAIRFYRRRLTRFTPACPSTPSCSAYALTAVEELGPRRGLAAAARRVRACGPAPRR